MKQMDEFSASPRDRPVPVATQTEPLVVLDHLDPLGWVDMFDELPHEPRPGSVIDHDDLHHLGRERLAEHRFNGEGEFAVGLVRGQQH